MVLLDLKRYLQDRKQATLMDLALHFDTEPETMRGFLDPWLRKGRVNRQDLRAACGRGCSGCSCDASMEMYEWQDTY